MEKTPPQTFDADAVSLLLLGDEEEIKRGLELLHKHYERRLCGRLRKRNRLLTPDDLALCWLDTLASVLTTARSRKFKAMGSLEGFVWRILERRAVDAFRRSQRALPTTSNLVEELSATDLGWAWRHATKPELDDLIERVWAMIEGLPRVERAIARAYCCAFLEQSKPDIQATREMASKECGKVLTAAQVKSALRGIWPRLQVLLSERRQR